MNKNLSNSERLIRGMAGAGLIGLGLGSRNGWVSMLGIYPVYNAVAGYCYMYDLLDINTAYEDLL